MKRAEASLIQVMLCWMEWMGKGPLKLQWASLNRRAFLYVDHTSLNR